MGKGYLIAAIILMCVGFGNVIAYVATEGVPTESHRVIPPPSEVTTPPEEEAPKITELGKTTAIDQIKAYPEALDAAITQDEHDLSLAIIVPKGTSEARAKELGDAFVRLVKTFGLLDSDKSEPAPGKEIGEGIFNYLITVAYPDQTIIIQGAKVSFATHITW